MMDGLIPTTNLLFSLKSTAEDLSYRKPKETFFWTDYFLLIYPLRLNIILAANKIIKTILFLGMCVCLD